MNHAIILAGGLGKRMNSDIPKQYLKVKGDPIFLYSFRKFASCSEIDTITIVLADEWKPFVTGIVQNEKCGKHVIITQSGKSRQHSVLNGLNAIRCFASKDDLVFIHDSVRPLFPVSIIYDGIEACKTYDAALPVISVKDATYQSKDGERLSIILPREELFSGQSPECFVFDKFFRAHSLFSDIEIEKIRGSSELAFRAGLSVKLIPGTEKNFKITTIEDLHAFELVV